MEIKKRILTAVASSALIFNAFATSAFAGTSIVISGNGKDSESEVKLEVENKTDVTQQNLADVKNDVDVNADTGGNKANDNLGGEVSIDTGNVTSKVTINNTLNSNTAQLDCCPTGDTTVEISGNLQGSDNDIKLELENKTKVNQYNDADVKNDVDVSGDTGGNKANDNGGNVTITTGNVSSETSISTVANANSVTMSGGGDGGSLSAKILDNGKDTENEIELEVENKTYVDQTNYADIENDVEIDADTGDNKANDNLGGEVLIDTGNVDPVKVDINNEVNFNFADLDCGCLLDEVLAKIAGNLEGSDNEIKAELEDKQDIDQYNDFDCAGRDACSDVDLDLETGDNKANDNGGPGDGDPSIETGNTGSDVKVDNTGNVNVVGDPGDIELPGGLNLHLSLDLGALLAWLIAHA